MTYKNKNTYKNVLITSIITVILITSGIGVAYANGAFPGENIFGTISGSEKNIASGWRSAAFGYYTEANDDNTVAFGYGGSGKK
jgi:hypothetical protein